MAQGLGFADSLTKHMRLMTGTSTPQDKLAFQGLLNLLKTNKNAEVVRLNEPNGDPGHRRTVIIKAKQRFNVAHTDTTRSCDQVNRMPCHEHTIPLTGFRQLAIQLEDETVARYPSEASKSIAVGKPPTPLMADLLDTIRGGADALLSAVNQDCWTLAAAQIGVNQRTGNANASAINFPLNTTNLPLAQGLTQLKRDYRLNQGIGRPMVVGDGLIDNFFIQQAAKSPNQSGLDTSILANGFEYFPDPRATVALGANQAIMYEPEAIQLVEYMRYKGFKAGEKGNSVFFIIGLPLQTTDKVKLIEFDCQLLYNDCPTTVTDAYYGTSLSIDKGWTLILSKDFDIFTIQADAYRATDLLVGNRGSYRYSFTNV